MLEKYEEKIFFILLMIKISLKVRKFQFLGGGDSALDWALELSKIAKVTLFIEEKSSEELLIL